MTWAYLPSHNRYALDTTIHPAGDICKWLFLKPVVVESAVAAFCELQMPLQLDERLAATLAAYDPGQSHLVSCANGDYPA
jgi:hypothetical protein